MAKSLRSTPGVRQEYNRADPDDIYRAQKAINAGHKKQLMSVLMTLQGLLARTHRYIETI